MTKDPISVTTISGGDDTPQPVRAMVSISLPISIWRKNGKVDLEEIARCLEQSTYRDGRFSFPTEQIIFGLQDRLKDAVYAAIYQEMEREHGTYLVQVDSRTKMNIAYLKTQEALEGIEICVTDEIRKAEITEREEQ